MWRERTLRILLVLFGLIFTAAVYPLITSVRSGWRANKEDSLPMGLSLYVTMGIFLLLAARKPLANRGVIVFAAWLNIAHATVMAVMAVHLPNERQDLLIASAVFACIGAVLILLIPGKEAVERVSSVEV
ncbi:MAG TPA: DUF6632 domain-containing protein [Terriglobales bacterium]|jgi:hypothetical protein|nr:DUF6632 domain-containing protein [Terriglobales bacterium]